MSEAFLFRRISEGRVTLLLDEVDTIFSTSKAEQNEGLRGLLNAGYRAGAKVGRVVGHGGNMQAVELDAFAPVALAGIGALPDTIQDRSIVLAMRRRAPDEQVERFRFRDAAREAGELQSDLASWGSHAEESLLDARPEIPQEIDDRAADCWEPLLAVAELAGDEWAGRGREAARRLSGMGVVEEQSLGTLLLADTREVFRYAERMRTKVLVDSLCALDESPWGDEKWRLDERRLAKRLRPYGIKPRQTRFADGTFKAYVRADFFDAWSRYLPAETTETTETDQTQQSHHSEDSVSLFLLEGEREHPELALGDTFAPAVASPAETGLAETFSDETAQTKGFVGFSVSDVSDEEPF